MNLSLIPPQVVGPNQSMLDKSILNMTDPGLSRIKSAKTDADLNGFSYPSLEELRELYFKKGKKKEDKK
tara:strand:+ start:193 stop:399 length:207 start_codon:yes stop_codon:yes gene_type:complete